MRIAVIGATGGLGAQTVPRLVERGHAVHALGTRPEALRRLEALGARPFVGSILDKRSLLPALAGCDAALHLATAVPRPGEKPDWARNDLIRREGTACLLEACRESQVVRYVQQSIAMLNADPARGWSDEASPIFTVPAWRSAADMEAMVQAPDLDWRIVRGGLFYGPGTGRETMWRELARRGELTIPGDGGDFVSLVHVADMAEAVVLAAESESGRFVVDAVDDEPVTYAELFRCIAAAEGAPEPGAGGPAALPSFRVRNANAKRRLGWAPFHRTYRSGLTG